MNKILTIAILTLSGCASMVDLEYGEKFWSAYIPLAAATYQGEETNNARRAPTTIVIEQERQCTPTFNKYGQTGCVW